MQIAASDHIENGEMQSEESIFALCDDGTLWHKNNSSTEWSLVESVPQGLYLEKITKELYDACKDLVNVIETWDVGFTIEKWSKVIKARELLKRIVREEL